MVDGLSLDGIPWFMALNTILCVPSIVLSLESQVLSEDS